MLSSRFYIQLFWQLLIKQQLFQCVRVGGELMLSNGYAMCLCVGGNLRCLSNGVYKRIVLCYHVTGENCNKLVMPPFISIDIVLKWLVGYRTGNTSASQIILLALPHSINVMRLLVELSLHCFVRQQYLYRTCASSLSYPAASVRWETRTCTHQNFGCQNRFWRHGQNIKNHLIKYSV